LSQAFWRLDDLLSENDAELWERFLAIEARVSVRTQRLLQAGLPAQISHNSRIVFVTYANADFELPKEFGLMFWVNQDECVHSGDRDDCTSFRPHHLASIIHAQSCIVAVTQQLARPWPIVQHGWKTVCVIEFPEGVPSMIDDLPQVHEWGISRKMVCLCDYPTWSALVDREPC
jgi:hypothetical protein